MKLNQPFLLRTGLSAAFAAVLVFGVSASALAQTEWIVHSFNSPFGVQGVYPMGNLVADGAGNLYGTTQEGGSSGEWGVVYELVRPVPPKTAWTEVVLHSFTDGTDGGGPVAGLVIDPAGNLYGTTVKGTSSRHGVVFELQAPSNAGGKWKEIVLHVFQPESGDGSYPQTGLTWDHSGNLVGVTPSGGANRPSACGGNCGTVFELSPPSTPGGAWTETILQNFKWGQGVEPRGTPVVAANGTLYGTTYGGGVYGEGVLYQLTPPATPGGAWNYRVLHAFTGRFDGQAPIGALVLRGKGVLYGTSEGGGAYAGGMVFQFVPPTAPGGDWTENVLCSFGSATGDGEGPTQNVVFDSTGNIYGVTIVGGTANGGTVFRCAPPTSPGGDWTETVLHSFGEGSKDGVSPSGGLLLGTNGVLFGVTQTDKANRQGTVYGVTK